MFGFLKGRKKSLIGLDIGSNVVKCLRLESGGARPVVTHFAMVPLVPEAIVDGEIMDRDLVIQAIRECAELAHVPNEPVASAVSGRAVIVKKIVMDKMSQTDAKEAIYWEAEQHVPFDIDDISLAFQVLREDVGANQMEVLLVAAKKDMILSHADLIRDAGFKPAVIDVASFANQNAWEFARLTGAPDEGDEAAPAAGGEFVALLDIGGGVTNVNIIRNGVPYFTRDLPVGTARFAEEFQKQIGLTFEQAQAVTRGHLEGVNVDAVTELVRTVGAEIYHGLEPSLSYLRAAGEAEGIDRIVISGGGAKLPGLSEFLAGCYEVKAEIADPLSALDWSPEVFGENDPAELSPLLAVTVGLALRKAVEA